MVSLPSRMRCHDDTLQCLLQPCRGLCVNPLPDNVCKSSIATAAAAPLVAWKAPGGPALLQKLGFKMHSFETLMSKMLDTRHQSQLDSFGLLPSGYYFCYLNVIFSVNVLQQRCHKSTIYSV